MHASARSWFTLLPLVTSPSVASSGHAYPICILPLTMRIISCRNVKYLCVECFVGLCMLTLAFVSVVVYLRLSVTVLRCKSWPTNVAIATSVSWRANHGSSPSLSIMLGVMWMMNCMVIILFLSGPKCKNRFCMGRIWLLGYTIPFGNLLTVTCTHQRVLLSLACSKY